MKTCRILVLSTALAVPGLPALAWDNTTNGNGPQQIVDGGPGAQANARSASAAVSASRSSARATGGAAYGGQGGVAYGGSGGTASASGGSVTNSVSVSAGGSGGYHAAARPPDVIAPGGGGTDCPTVGFGAGGAGIGGGGGIGPSWISSRCDHRRYAELILQLTGDRQAALEYLASVESDVKDFLDDYRKKREDAPFRGAAAPVQAKPDYCEPGRGWTAAQLRARYLECR